MRVPGGFCSTECVIGIGHKVGDIGSYVGIRIVTRITGDRRATDEGLSLVVYAIRMPMQNSEKRRFIVDECRSDVDVVKETAIAVLACVVMRDIYAARTAGTCECAPASHVEVIHSM